jgi:hypothetical protein
MIGKRSSEGAVVQPLQDGSILDQAQHCTTDVKKWQDIA